MSTTVPTPAALAKKSPRATVTDADQRHHRGDIWMVVSDPTQPAVGTELWSNRPAVIVSNNVINGRAGFAQVVYLTTATRKKSGPLHVELPTIEGKGTSLVLCEQIHTVDASRLQRKLGIVPGDRIADLDAAIALSLSLGRNPDTYSVFRKWEEYVKLHGVDLASEINALSGHTTDERVESLTRALSLVAAERDAYQALYESLPRREAALEDVAAALATSDAV